jgi:serine-type D-Ala-D-Ala carboxypeptidase/endopeptidase (penicillin-binding protein 4)
MVKETGKETGKAIIFGFALGLLLPTRGLTQTTIATCPALVEKIDRIIDQPQFRPAHWGILVQTTAKTSSKTPDKTTLYQRNSDQLLIPASNAKLLTTAAALQKFGPNYRRTTALYDQGNGNFTLIGQGDPSFGEAQLQDLARQLKAQKIDRISRLSLQEGSIGGPLTHPNWEWGDLQSGYAPRINSLILNQNAIELRLTPQTLGKPLQWEWVTDTDRTTPPFTIDNQTRTVNQPLEEFTEGSINGNILQLRGQLQVGAEADTLSVAIPDPGEQFAQRLRQEFSRQGITIDHLSVRHQQNPSPKNPPIAAIQSPTIAALIQTANQTSNNLYAEILLRWLNSQGLTELQTQLQSLGITSSSYQLVDGSGLSRQDLVTPTALVALLQIMGNNPTYRASLAQSATSGTLKNRLKDLPPGQIQAKTGYLTAALGLSGYANGPEPRTFSILLNHSTLDLATQRNSIDGIAKAIATTPCP